MKTILWGIEAVYELIRITIQHFVAKARYNLAQQQQARLRNRIQSRKGK